MGWNDHVDSELDATITDRVEEGYIVEGTADYGIAQQVIHQGYDSLSTAQKWTFDNRVLISLRRLQEHRKAERLRELVERDDYVGFTTGL
jgi:hypothetical protein